MKNSYRLNRPKLIHHIKTKIRNFNMTTIEKTQLRNIMQLKNLNKRKNIISIKIHQNRIINNKDNFNFMLKITLHLYSNENNPL
jgi:hypothetical protein